MRSDWARQAERQLASGHYTTDDDLVVCDAAGEPLWGRHLTTLSFKALRSGSMTCATTLIVSEVLGHRVVGITLDR